MDRMLQLKGNSLILCIFLSVSYQLRSMCTSGTGFGHKSTCCASSGAMILNFWRSLFCKCRLRGTCQMHETLILNLFSYAKNFDHAKKFISIKFHFAAKKLRFRWSFYAVGKQTVATMQLFLDCCFIM